MIKALYADGGVIRCNPSPIGGMYAWCIVQANERVKCGSGIVTPDQIGLDLVTNNFTEYLALVSGLEQLPEGWSGQVCSDSQNALGRLFDGWKVNGIPASLIQRAYAALKRLDVPNIKPILLCGHPTQAELRIGFGKRGYPVSQHNVWCDTECQRLGKQYMQQLEVAA